jgi:hypothetical protein
MADLLGRLETGLQRASGASARLRSQVDRIDGYMRTSGWPLSVPHPPLHRNSLSKPELPLSTGPYTPRSGQGPPVGPPTAMGEQMMMFQLPPELLSDWPWPLDGAHSEGFMPLAFE